METISAQLLSARQPAYIINNEDNQHPITTLPFPLALRHRLPLFINRSIEETTGQNYHEVE